MTGSNTGDELTISPSDQNPGQHQAGEPPWGDISQPESVPPSSVVFL